MPTFLNLDQSKPNVRSSIYSFIMPEHKQAMQNKSENGFVHPDPDTSLGCGGFKENM